MTKKEEIHNEFKNWELNPKDFNNNNFQALCDFVVIDEYLGKKRRVYFADSMGLNHKENPGCHCNLSLYYDTHLALTIPFASHDDAKRFVFSGGKDDNRIISKTAKKSGGWAIKTRKETTNATT